MNNKLILLAVCLLASALITNVPLQVERIGWVGTIVFVVVAAFSGLYLPALIVHRIILVIKGRMKHENV